MEIIYFNNNEIKYGFNILIIEEINDKIQSFKFPNFSLIPVEYFEKKNNKTTKLVNNKKSRNNLIGKHQWFNFLVRENIYVHQVRIYTEKYGSLDACEFRFIDYLGNTVELRPQRNSDDTFVFNVNTIISSFSFGTYILV